MSIFAGSCHVSVAPSCHHVALLVLSAPENFEQRSKLRKLRLEGFTLHFLFLIGRSDDTIVEDMLEKVLARINHLVEIQPILLILGQKEQEYYSLDKKTTTI